MKIKKNDVVLVITGKDRGKKGKVRRALPKNKRVVVEAKNALNLGLRQTDAALGDRTPASLILNLQIKHADTAPAGPALAQDPVRLPTQIEGQLNGHLVLALVNQLIITLDP